MKRKLALEVEGCEDAIISFLKLLAGIQYCGEEGLDGEVHTTILGGSSGRLRFATTTNDLFIDVKESSTAVRDELNKGFPANIIIK